MVKMVVIEQAEQVWGTSPSNSGRMGNGSSVVSQRPGVKARNRGLSLSVLGGAQVRPGWAGQTAHAPGLDSSPYTSALPWLPPGRCNPHLMRGG